MRTLRILHKWLALIVGLQLLLWTASGFVFAFLDHADVAAERSLRDPQRVALPRDLALREPGTLLGNGAGQVVDATLMPIHDTWVYRLRFTDRVDLRRAADGAAFSITAPLARELAVANYAGRGRLRSVSFQERPGLEARGAGPVWEATFDDPERTHLYFSAQDGRLVAARNDSWRAFDFFWMLHTMDYRGRDDFNHPLAILFATGALWLGLSGALLLLQSFGLTRRLESRPRSGVRTPPI